MSSRVSPYPVRKRNEYSRIDAWPLDKMKRSRSGQVGSAGSWRMIRVNRTCANGASAMAVPGWPESAFWGASMARPRTTLIPSCSSSASVTGRTVPAGWEAITRRPSRPWRRSRRRGPGSAPDRSRSSATDAVKPWTKLRPPTGPSSPAAKNPAIGTAPRCSDRTRTSWCGWPNRRVPRPLQVKTRAASARCAATSAWRSSSAVAASRRWNCTVVPTSMGSATAMAPEDRSAPTTLRTRKSPRPNCSLCSSMTRPRCRPPVSRRTTSSSLSESRAWANTCSRAGRPASSYSRLCSALVTTRGSPKGRHPWDTRVATSAPGPRNTPTAPPVRTRVPSARRFPPGPRAADAMPPTTRRPG